MDHRTRQTLAHINADFYRKYASAFSESRRLPWPSWQRVAWHFAAVSEGVQRPGVLDVGCGNGRFGRFLAQALGRPLAYVGLDASRQLLALAADGIGDLPLLAGARFVEYDLVLGPAHPDGRDSTEGLPAEADALPAEADALPPDAGYRHRLVVLFGLLHHVPGKIARRALLDAAAQRLQRGGLLALSFWQFAARARFADKIVGWDAVPELALDSSELEPGDHLVTWGDGALRYCHFANRDEEDWLLDLTGLRVVDRFEADGRSGDLNRIAILQRDG